MANKYTSEQKAEALAIAEATSQAEAEARTGIPMGTIGWWASSERAKTPHKDRLPKQMQTLSQEAAMQAKENVAGYITERLKGLADGLYELAEQGLTEVKSFMAKPGGKDRDTSAWLRAVIGAMHYGIQDAQLLSGKPTMRPEVVERREYNITAKFIAEHPEYVDVVFSERTERRRGDVIDAEFEQPRLASGGGESTHTGLG